MDCYTFAVLIAVISVIGTLWLVIDIAIGSSDPYCRQDEWTEPDITEEPDGGDRLTCLRENDRRIYKN